MGDRDDRPKKSWREMDTQRERGGRREPPRDQAQSTSNTHSSKQHRAALEALFQKGGMGKIVEQLAPPPVKAPPPAPAPSAAEHPLQPQKPVVDSRTLLRRKVLEAIGRDEISRAMDRFVKEFGLPEDFEVLEQAIEHKNRERIADALALLEKMLEQDKPKRSRVLAAKLRLIEETADEPTVCEAAKRVRARLG